MFSFLERRLICTKLRLRDVACLGFCVLRLRKQWCGRLCDGCVMSWSPNRSKRQQGKQLYDGGGSVLCIANLVCMIEMNFSGS